MMPVTIVALVVIAFFVGFAVCGRLADSEQRHLRLYIQYLHGRAAHARAREDWAYRQLRQRPAAPRFRSLETLSAEALLRETGYSREVGD